MLHKIAVQMIKTEQENLNRLYDAFTEKYGLINNRGNYLAFAADESYFLLCSLEVLDVLLIGNLVDFAFVLWYLAVYPLHGLRLWIRYARAAW